MAASKIGGEAMSIRKRIEKMKPTAAAALKVSILGPASLKIPSLERRRGAYPSAGIITRMVPGLRASTAASTAKGGSTRPAYILCKCRARIARLTFLI